MKEIKFRFWHKTKKRMSRVLGLGVIWEYLCEEWGLFDWKDIEKLQYTGRHDIKSNEVYDGDIWQRGGFIAVVAFENSQWVLNKALSSSCYAYPSFWSNIATGIVIGNIYENPELLEGA